MGRGLPLRGPDVEPSTFDRQREIRDRNLDLVLPDCEPLMSECDRYFDALTGRNPETHERRVPEPSAAFPIG
jgi:hypothetical protein